MLQFPVFADQVSSLSDARYFAAQGVEWLGFELGTSRPNALQPAEIVEIREWVEGPKIAVHLQNPDEAAIREAIASVRPDAICVSADTPLDILEKEYNIPLFKEIPVSPDRDWAMALEWAAPFVEGLLLRGDRPVTEAHSLEVLKEICRTFDLYVDLQVLGDTPPEAVARAREVQVAGIIITDAQTEQTIGIRSFDEMDTIFEYLQEGNV